MDSRRAVIEASAPKRREVQHIEARGVLLATGDVADSHHKAMLFAVTASFLTWDVRC